jgi:hypothetical protein
MSDDKIQPATLVALILQAILEEDEDEDTNFKKICNRDWEIFGKKSTERRRLCQYRHSNYRKIQRKTPELFLALLAKHDVLANMSIKRGKTHSDQNKNDVNFSSDDDDTCKFVFVAHFVFSFISFDKFLLTIFFLQFQRREKRK